MTSGSSYMDKQSLRQLEDSLQYKFSDISLLEKALTHASSAESRLHSNERMEFLGDALLAVVICEGLFERFDNYLEGDLTKIKSKLVSRKTCSQIAAELGLNEVLKVGPGMAKSSSLNGSLAAGVIEAVIAAIHLDGGFDKVREFVLRVFGPLITNADAREHQENYKSVLQQHVQQQLNTVVSYELLDEKGPDHNKCFECAAVINGYRYPSAWGTNKKEAQQQAAHNALVKLNLLENEKQNQ
ncbi:MAG: ribonuclease III [Planctomycetes bacterium]|nr:ribonuclease III [Planctomycetota bacterium]